MSVTRTPTRVRAAFIALSAASLVVLTTAGGVGRGLTLTTVSVAVAVWILVGLLRGHVATGPLWWLVFVAFCFLSGYNVTWLIAVDLGGATAPPQPITEIALAVAYVFLLAASLFAISPVARQDFGGVLDASTAGVGGAIALWLTVLDPALNASHAPAATRAYSLVVVVILSAVTGALMRALASSRAARPALAYFLTAVTLTLAGNVLTIVVPDPRTGVAPTWVAAVWPIAYAASWAAAAHPASAAITDEAGLRKEARLSPRRIVLLGLALGVGPLLGAAGAVSGTHVDWLTLTISQLLLVAMILVRVSQLAAAHRGSAKQLEYIADHDSLTGLANRRAVDRHLEQLVTRVGAAEAPGILVLFVDLNGFKTINDNYGHAVGDELLAAVASRLARTVRQDGDDLVGRLGGDEFVLVVEADPSLAGQQALARVREAFADPFVLTSGPMLVSASIGITTASPDTVASVDVLLTQADHAMYEHKRATHASDAGFTAPCP